MLTKNPGELKELDDAIAALLSEGPTTSIAALKWKRAIARGGQEMAGLARDIFVGVVSAGVARQMGLA